MTEHTVSDACAFVRVLVKICLTRSLREESDRARVFASTRNSHDWAHIRCRCLGSAVHCGGYQDARLVRPRRANALDTRPACRLHACPPVLTAARLCKAFEFQVLLSSSRRAVAAGVERGVLTCNDMQARPAVHSGRPRLAGASVPAADVFREGRSSSAAHRHAEGVTKRGQLAPRYHKLSCRYHPRAVSLILLT